MISHFKILFELPEIKKAGFLRPFLIHLTLGLWFFRFKLSFGFHRLQRFQRTRFMLFFRGFYSLFRILDLVQFFSSDLDLVFSGFLVLIFSEDFGFYSGIFMYRL